MNRMARPLWRERCLRFTPFSPRHRESRDSKLQTAQSRQTEDPTRSLLRLVPLSQRLPGTRRFFRRPGPLFTSLHRLRASCSLPCPPSGFQVPRLPLTFRRFLFLRRPARFWPRCALPAPRASLALVSGLFRRLSLLTHFWHKAQTQRNVIKKEEE